jgi:hypothetical protein
MGPPLSPREPRRSGRRALPAPISTSSLTPDSPRPPDSPASAHTHIRKENGHRPALSSANSSTSGKSKRSSKLDDHDDTQTALQDHPQNATARATPPANPKKRKGKDKDRPPPIQIITQPAHISTDNVEDAEAEGIPGDEEDSSVTRCICGRQDAGPLQALSFSFLLRVVSSHCSCCDGQMTTRETPPSWYSAKTAMSGSTASVLDSNPTLNSTA